MCHHDFFYPYDVHAFVIKFSEFSGYLRKINEKFMILRVRGVAFRPLGGAHGPQQAPRVYQKRDPKATQKKRPPREAQRSPLGRFGRNRLGAHVHLRQGNMMFQRWTLFRIFFIDFFVKFSVETASVAMSILNEIHWARIKVVICLCVFFHIFIENRVFPDVEL